MDATTVVVLLAVIALAAVVVWLVSRTEAKVH